MINLDNGLKQLNNVKNLYHLSRKEIKNNSLTPSVPDNFLTQNGYEDNTIKRVCFSTSINKCLTALSENVSGKEFYVYEVKDINKYEIYKPSKELVPDCEITDEVWILEPVKLKLVGKIKCISDDGKDGMSYKYGNNTAELYGWIYEWIDKEI